MSERLTDRDLDTIQASACWLIDRNKTAYVLPDALDAARIQIALVAELRERRAADLTADDASALRLAVAMLRESTRGAIQNAAYVERSCAVIDKLLKGAK